MIAVQVEMNEGRLTRGARTTPEPTKTWPDVDQLTIASSMDLESEKKPTSSPTRSLNMTDLSEDVFEERQTLGATEAAAAASLSLHCRIEEWEPWIERGES